MNNVAILGDTHFGMRGDSVIFHDYYRKFYDNVFFPYLLKNNIKIIYQLGDLFDRRKYINFNSLYLSRKYFFDKLKEYNMSMITLLGNHDVVYKNTLEVNSSELLLREYNNITVIRDCVTHSVEGVSIDIVPWICDENQDSVMQFMSQSKSQICFGHFEIDGFQMDRGNVHKGGMDRSTLQKYDMVLSGHFHHKSDNKHIYYVGTPGEMTWVDYNDPRGFHILNVNTRDLTFIQNPYNIFHKFNYDDQKQDFEYWKSFDYDMMKDCFVKIVVVSKQNPYLFDTVVDNLFKAGVADLSIVEDFTDSSIEDDEELINQAEDTFTILSNYIDNLTLDVDSTKLKNIMREIYVESLSAQSAE